MWQRTLTIGSAGKTFSSTGLKLGWTIGPKNLIRPCQIIHQVNCFKEVLIKIMRKFF
jgi:N-succinyldiaminopimelate aminotransferase